jgi:hypothetical protein
MVSRQRSKIQPAGPVRNFYVVHFQSFIRQAITLVSLNFSWELRKFKKSGVIFLTDLTTKKSSDGGIFTLLRIRGLTRRRQYRNR